ncbi:MAG: SDR family oxidoreductase [Alcanivoracaceae bacterium]|jgi:hypothetical protein|nr:SDR family oxidoreductase [Alcanivoracaceae bacterium]
MTGMNDKQVALVTGASSGIGADIARELAARGYQLVLVARREARLLQLAEELSQRHGTRCQVLACDLSDREALNGLMARADRWLDAEGLALTVLVNNAGTGVWANFSEQKREVSQRDIDINVTALTTLCHDFIDRAMAHGQPAHILNIASVAAFLPTPRFAVYSGTKAYVRRLSEILAYELKGSNVQVTCSCPGGTLTEFMEHAGQELKGNTGMMASAEVARQSVHAMLAGKTVFVPGLLNRLSLLGRFLPSKLQPGLVERSMLITVADK